MEFVRTLARRVVAVYIDMFASMFVGYLAYYIVQRFADVDLKFMAVIISVLLMILRDARGRSLGKQILRLHIVNEDGESKTTMRQRIIRNLTTPLHAFEGIAVLLRGDLRRWGDMLAKTKVIYAPDLSKGLLK